MNGQLWNLWQENPLIRLATYLVIAVVISVVVRFFAYALFHNLKKRHANLAPLIVHTARPMRWLAPLLTFAIVINAAPQLDELTWIPLLQRSLLFAMIAAATWLIVSAISGLEAMAFHVAPLGGDKSPRSRRLLTQVRVLSRTSMIVVTIIGLACLLMNVPAVRQFGASILASAGVAGLAVGFAAKPVLGNIIAGLQIAMTQPISLDDTVMVEGQVGFVEEISSAYVVIRTWDERRLVIPLSYFIENPISNWTRTDPNLVGAVFLWFDFRLPIEPIREELKRILEKAPEWNGKECMLSVSNSNEHAMELRILVSAFGLPLWWDLCCRVREGIIHFVVEHYPDCLPTARTRLQPDMQLPDMTSPFDPRSRPFQASGMPHPPSL